MKSTSYILFCIALIFVMSSCSTTITTVFLVRHAEKEGGTNPNLTNAGSQRALELERILHNVPLSAVYTTDFNRTYETALPTTQDHNLDTTQYVSNNVVGPIMANHRGKKVLVVGHSNTVPEIISAFGGESQPFGGGNINSNEFDNLIILSVYKKQTGQSTTEIRSEVIHMKYGE